MRSIKLGSACLCVLDGSGLSLIEYDCKIYNQANSLIFFNWHYSNFTLQWPQSMSIYSNITKVSSVFAKRALHNDQFIKEYNLDSTSEWIESMTGIKQRYFIESEDELEQMAVQAGCYGAGRDLLRILHDACIRTLCLKLQQATGTYRSHDTPATPLPKVSCTSQVVQFSRLLFFLSRYRHV